jgi:hypothetical protein
MNLAELPDGLDGKLVHVIEECAEVIQEACKVQRFGPNSHHPRDETRERNRDRLRRECDQLREAIERLEVELRGVPWE